MTCHQARQQLAAYRRDDWTGAELRLLSEHLATCADCRAFEAQYRRVGESLRLLPTITPDASFRASVYAAIAADQRKLGPAAMRVSRAETEPSMPVVRAPVTPFHRRREPRPVLRAGLGIAAVLTLALLSSQFVPGLATGGFAASLLRGATSADLSAHITLYQPDARYNAVTSVRATKDWLAYTATDASGATALIVTNRHKSQSRNVFASSTTGAVKIYGLTAHWVVWSDAANGWTLHATALTGANLWQTTTLAQGDAAGSLLTGAWADDSHALYAVSPAAGGGSLYSTPLAGGASALIAQASTPDGILASPTSANGVIYWNDVWTDAAGHLHGDIWRSTGGTNARVSASGDEAFGVAAANGRVLWVNSGKAPANSAVDAAGIAREASQTQGTVEAQSLPNGAAHALDGHGSAGSLQAAGALAVWNDNGAYNAWNLSQNAADPLKSQLGGAKAESVGADTLAWFDGSNIAVYNV